MIPAFEANGALPVGRFCCSLEEAKQFLVLSPSFQTVENRQTLWTIFEDSLRRITDIRCKVPSVFLGGSFVTSQVDPNDIDAAYLVDYSTILTEQTYGKLDQIFRAINQENYIDAFQVPWHPTNLKKHEPYYEEYYLERGKWDDFWQRKVSETDRIPWQRSHAFPKRGYLEVTVDGYR